MVITGSCRRLVSRSRMVDRLKSRGVVEVNVLVAGGVGLVAGMVVMVRFILLFIVSVILVGVYLMHVGRVVGVLVDIVLVVDVVVRVYGHETFRASELHLPTYGSYKINQPYLC